MAGLGDLFSSAGSSAEQLFIWQVLGAVVQALMTPVSNELTQHALGLDPNTPLDPGVAAAMVAQQIIGANDGAAEAKLSGVDGERFANLTTAAGNALDLSAVIAAYQRGLINDGSFDPTDVSLHGAIASSAIRQDWAPILKQLSVSIPSVAEVMNAWLEGQIGEDEARTRYLAAGGDPTWFQTSYDSNGQAPTPVELLTMLNRGIIPQGGTGPDAVSYDQGFLEGPWRNKWEQAFLELAAYYPPPRTVTAMYHGGQLTKEQASEYLAKQGLSADLIAAYLTPAVTATTTTEKTLAKTDILALYADQLISASRATDLLVAIKYPKEAAQELIALQDFKLQKSQLTAGVDQVRTLYRAGKITKADAKTALEALDITGDQATAVIETWDITATQTVKTLTAAQIVDLWYYEIFTVEQAVDALKAEGYDGTDAFNLLQIKNKGPLPVPAFPLD